MSFLSNLTNKLPLGKKEDNEEYFFAINIGAERLTAALWVIEGSDLKVLDTAFQDYASNEEIASVTDKLLDQVLGVREIEPQKILFGVPNTWILDDNLKDEYLKILRNLVKELELTPMAYVSTSNALVHFLEKQEGVPTTAILAGFEKAHLTVTVVRAGKLDGVKIVARGESSGADLEKALLAFSNIGTLPSKILIYGEQTENLKTQLLSFSWMSKLSFLHFPKIDILEDDIEIKSTCLAGGSEINDKIKFVEQTIQHGPLKSASNLAAVEPEDRKEKAGEKDETEQEQAQQVQDGDNFGFVVGDVSEEQQEGQGVGEGETDENGFSGSESRESAGTNNERELAVPSEHNIEIEDFEPEVAVSVEPLKSSHKRRFNLKKFIPKGNFTVLIIIIGIFLAALLIAGAFAFLFKADVKVFVEPKINESDAQVVADPSQKTVNEDSKIIPGQIVEVDVSGSATDTATGKRQIGDPSKGTVKIINNASSDQTFSKGTTLTASGGVKFTLDQTVNIASTSAISESKSTANTTVTAVNIGADGNLPSGTQFTIAGGASSGVAIVAEGNFSGGTSKNVTVVSSEDQQRLLAKLSSELKQQAQQKLQEKYPAKKILQEALLENITKKSYNKNINDQANEFSLSATVHYKGTAYDDNDLKSIVSKLVNTQVPDGFQLDLSGTETQADVSKLEKDGKLVFLARFKAKFIPKIDTEKIKNQIKFKTPAEAADLIKSMDNVLGSEINLAPKLPTILQRLPLFSKNITVEVGLK